MCPRPETLDRMDGSRRVGVRTRRLARAIDRRYERIDRKKSLSVRCVRGIEGDGVCRASPRARSLNSSDLGPEKNVMAAFKLHPIARSDDAFGPPRNALVESEIREMIYAPYNKTDKFGRCARIG